MKISLNDIYNEFFSNEDDIVVLVHDCCEYTVMSMCGDSREITVAYDLLNNENGKPIRNYRAVSENEYSNWKIKKQGVREDEVHTEKNSN